MRQQKLPIGSSGQLHRPASREELRDGCDHIAAARNKHQITIGHRSLSMQNDLTHQVPKGTSREGLLLHDPSSKVADFPRYPPLGECSEEEVQLWFETEQSAAPHQHPWLATIMSVSVLVGIIIFILFCM